MTKILHLQDNGGTWHTLKGPYDPAKISKRGYGFTPDPAAAWPFPSPESALAVARDVASHMGWPGAARLTDAPAV